jgi:structural maintenance of chromosome 4
LFLFLFLDNREVDSEEDNNSTNRKSASKIQKLNKKTKARRISMSVDEYLDDETLVFGRLSSDQLSELAMPAIESDIVEYKTQLQSSKVNMGAIEAYRRKDSDYVRRLHDLESCKQRRDLVRAKFEDLKCDRFDLFMKGFKIITVRLKEMYRMLTCGGDAELELVDSIDPFSEGVQFSVRPPKKSWKNISNLSGGEKTLSSMALVFALHDFRPTPLYVMDEIDAALDFKNVSIVANYIHEQTQNAQFVIISLRNNMFELAHRLVGIYKTHNTTKTITIDPHLFYLKNQQSQQSQNPKQRKQQQQQSQSQQKQKRSPNVINNQQSKLKLKTTPIVSLNQFNKSQPQTDNQNNNNVLMNNRSNDNENEDEDIDV